MKGLQHPSHIDIRRERRDIDDVDIGRVGPCGDERIVRMCDVPDLHPFKGARHV